MYNVGFLHIECVIQGKQHPELLQGRYIDQLIDNTIHHIHVDFSGYVAVDALSELNNWLYGLYNEAFYVTHAVIYPINSYTAVTIQL